MVGSRTGMTTILQAHGWDTCLLSREETEEPRGSGSFYLSQSLSAALLSPDCRVASRATDTDIQHHHPC